MGLLSFLSKLSDSNAKGPLRGTHTPEEDPNSIVINGGQKDPWKPHKDTILGALADGIASYTGDGTPFQDERDKRNLHEAFDGFAANPMQAIRRVGQIRGQEKNAWDMRKSYVDDERQQGNLDRQNGVFDMQRKEKAYNLLANMMGAVRPGDKASWTAMRGKALKWLELNNLSEMADMIPEDGDMSGAQVLQSGAVPVKNQMTIDETKRSHMANETLRGEGIQVQRERNSVMGAQGGARIGIAQQNANESARTHKTNEQLRQDEINRKPPTKPGRAFISTKYGTGETSEDGKVMRIRVDPSRINDTKGHIKYLDADGNPDPQNGDPYLIYEQLKPNYWRVRK
jgi:hypothetical protein